MGLFGPDSVPTNPLRIVNVVVLPTYDGKKRAFRSTKLLGRAIDDRCRNLSHFSQYIIVDDGEVIEVCVVVIAEHRWAFWHTDDVNRGNIGTTHNKIVIVRDLAGGCIHKQIIKAELRCDSPYFIDKFRRFQH